MGSLKNSHFCQLPFNPNGAGGTMCLHFFHENRCLTKATFKSPGLLGLTTLFIAWLSWRLVFWSKSAITLLARLQMIGRKQSTERFGHILFAQSVIFSGSMASSGLMYCWNVPMTKDGQCDNGAIHFCNIQHLFYMPKYDKHNNNPNMIDN